MLSITIDLYFSSFHLRTYQYHAQVDESRKTLLDRNFDFKYSRSGRQCNTYPILSRIRRMLCRHYQQRCDMATFFLLLEKTHRYRPKFHAFHASVCIQSDHGGIICALHTRISMGYVILIGAALYAIIIAFLGFLSDSDWNFF